MKIPLHSMVLCPRIEQIQRFASHECLSLQSIIQDLVGDTRQIEMHRIALQELRRRIGLKLSLGERVVVATAGMTPDCQQLITAVAQEQGAYIIDLRNARELPDPVRPFTSISREQYRGITIIGDVHGDLHQLKTALGWAESRQNFAWLLGDVIDYGRDTLACVETTYEAVMHGRAGLILGNHERKIARWIDERHVRTNDGNRVTIDALSALSSSDRRQWIGRFRSLLAHAFLLYQIENVTLIHAAAHPSLWSRDANLSQIEQFGLYGQGETNGRFRRVHHWVDSVPHGKMVFVGHDVIAPVPIIITGAQGGQVVFLDTGCGKGGSLATADLRFSDTGLRLECFNSYPKESS